MKTVKQLLRQPLKTLAGLVLMTLAAAIACLCVGQALAAQETKKGLDERFSTIALFSLQEELQGVDQILVEQEMLQWLQEMAAQYPDIVQGTERTGFLSAYIPQLQPFNTSTHSTNQKNNQAIVSEAFEQFTSDPCFDSAMLVITLEEIGQVKTPQDTLLNHLLGRDHFDSDQEYNAYLAWYAEQDKNEEKEISLQRTPTNGYTVSLTGTVTQVLSLPEDVRDPVGMTARLTLTLSTMQELDALNLTVGQQYVVYGMDYCDEYRYFVEQMKKSSFKHVPFEPYDPALLKPISEQEKQYYWQNKRIDAVILYNYVPLDRWQYARLNAISMTMCSPINLLNYKFVSDDSGNWVDCVPPTAYSYTDGSGNTVTLSAEELNARYAVPTIAPLEGSVEEFLASEAGAAWQTALMQSRVNNHAFSVLGVGDVHQMPMFALEMAQIEVGREFTAEEIASGAKVCLIHEWVAEKAGLQLGDTITLSFYETDYGVPYKPNRGQDKGLLRPAASLYFGAAPFVETAEYTVVGFWQGNVWPSMSESYYSFSANTVLVPQSSVQAPMEQILSLPFVAASLENGTIDQFRQLVNQGGYGNRFKFTDQGYSELVSNFHNYEALAWQIMAVGIVVYAILLLLFLLLYPASQRKTVRTMASMGCHFGQRFGHVLLSSMLIMVLAAVLGAWAGTFLWEQLMGLLQETADSNIKLELQPAMLLQIATVQLLAGLVLSSLVAAFVAAPRGISQRR